MGDRNYETGFDAFVDETDGEYSQFVLERISEVCEPYGLDCTSINFGERGNMAAELSLGQIVIGTLAFLNQCWGFSYDNENMFQSNSIEEAVMYLLNPYIENGGLVG